MDNMLKVIELYYSDNTSEWKLLSEQAIQNGSVERLSSKGLFQAISNLGYRLACDGYLQCTQQTAMSEADYNSYLETLFVQIDEIQDVIALSSGIEINIITDLVSQAADYYTTQFALCL